MEIFNLIILGIIQGLTEFLPVSSSGHLVFAQHFLHIEFPGTTLEVILHLGTLTSILLFYRKDIFELLCQLFKRNTEALKFFSIIIIGIIPAGVAGIFFKDYFVSFFKDLFFTSCFLLFTGLILLLSKFMEHNKNPLSFKSVFMVGLIQVFSIFPGVSRSGMTISLALLLGIEKQEAFKLSFFLAIPIILGASILEIPQVLNMGNLNLLHLFIGFVVAAGSGYIALNLLYEILIKNKFWIFSFYCFTIGLIGVVYAR